jgi:hypothetical protein
MRRKGLFRVVDQIEADIFRNAGVARNRFGSPPLSGRASGKRRGACRVLRLRFKFAAANLGHEDRYVILSASLVGKLNHLLASFL